VQTNFLRLLYGTAFLFLSHLTHAQELSADSSKITDQPPGVTKDTTQTKTGGKKSNILSKIRYTAKDSIILKQSESRIYLYNQAELYYQDMELKSGVIILDYLKNEVYAGRLRNKEGILTQTPDFKQGSNSVEPDSIRFNIDTQKALIWNSRTQQNAGGGMRSENMNVKAQYTKKENDSVFFLKDVILTSSMTPEDPDYYIKINRAKFVPQKKMVAGFSNLYIADVPTPVALPFAYFPLTTGRTAGLMMPTFGNDPRRGYFLQNGGYYIPISDYVDLNLTGDLYSNGSYGFRAQSVYTKKYKYNGNFNFRYENLVNSQKGFSDYARNTIYNLQLSHSQDGKAHPTARFSASVNLGSSQYFRNSLNQMNLPNTQNNNLSSSINFNKTFPEYPSVNMSLTASHNQNTNTQEVNLTLPTLQASMERIYPFVARGASKKGIFQNINLQYSVRGENRIRTTDSLFLTPRMFEDSRMGMKHSIPFNTNFKVAKHFSVSLGGNFEDNWVTQTFARSMVEDRIVLDTLQGFDRFSQYNLSASIGTTLYGTFVRKEGKRIQALRHVMRPSASIGYTPAYDQYYDEYLGTDGTMVPYSRFEGTLYGAPGLNSSQSLGFSLQNALEAKVRSKDSTRTEPRKVKIIENLTISSSYNFQADSLRLNPFRFTGGTSLFDNQLKLNINGILDPYDIDAQGRRINTLVAQQNGALMRLTRASANLSYSINSDMFKKDKKQTDSSEDSQESQGDLFYAETSQGRTDGLFGRNSNPYETGYNKPKKPSEIKNPVYATDIQWNFNLAYAVTFANEQRQSEFSNNSLMFSGDIQLTPKWGMGVSSGYDFKNQGFTLTQIRIDRDLNDFRLNFDWTPFGAYERWYFFIGIKSSMLSDLKWEKRNQR